MINSLLITSFVIIAILLGVSFGFSALILAGIKFWEWLKKKYDL